MKNINDIIAAFDTVEQLADQNILEDEYCDSDEDRAMQQDQIDSCMFFSKFVNRVKQSELLQSLIVGEMLNQ